MRDCSNAAMRDALPDLLHDTLSPARRAEVRAHVDACADCRAELELLAEAKRLAVAPQLDAGRIVAALPAYRRRPGWQRVLDHGAWRAAAAIVLLAGGAALVLSRSDDVSGARLVDTLAQATVQPSAPVPTELSVGETFQDVSDSELRALVDAIDTLDGEMLAEPARIAVPLDPSEGL